MDKQFVTTSASPHITLDVGGNLSLKGQDSNEVTAKSSDPEDITLESNDDQVSIRSRGDCSVRVPRLAIVHVSAARGDATFKAFEGELTIDQLDGNLAMRYVGKTTINRINGDLSAKYVSGNFVIGDVSGDVAVRDVQGDFVINGSLHGSLNLGDVDGNAKASADGNITLRLDPTPMHQYEFNSHGNLFCRLPEDASVEISVPKASQVRVNLPGIHATAPVQTPYALTLGDGDARISLSASGNVALDTHAPEWEMQDFDIDVGPEVEGMADAISQQISQQVDSQVRMMEDQLNAQLSGLSMRLGAAKLTEEQARRIEERAREASERAASRAQEKMRRAQEKMEQKMASMQRKMEMRTRERERISRHEHRHWSFNIPTPPVPPTGPGEQVSEDERLMILRMLQEKKISMEEAEQLLSALEGKE